MTMPVPARALLPCLLSLFISPSPAAEVSDTVLRQAAEFRDRAMDESDAYRLVESLSVKVGPRFAGTAGDRAAVAWAVETMRSIGFDTVRTQSVAVPRWERGTMEARVVAPYPQPLVALALGGSVGTPEAGITAPVVRVESLADLTALPDSQVEGRIVFIDAYTRRSRDATGYVESRPARSSGPAVASRKGAVAAVVRSVGTSTSRLAHTGATRFPDGVTPIPAAALSPADADLLTAQLRSGETVRLYLKMSSRALPDGVSANVIGEIRGQGSANEIVLLGAHLDSWDVGTGAVDDGTGVAIVLEVARLIIGSGLRPDRTLRVVLFANEEFGLTGARAYAEAAAAEEARHVLGMESDLGGGRIWRLDSGVGESGLATVAAMAALTAVVGAPAGNNKASGGADLKYLREAGMPILAPRHDATRYFDVHHTIADTLDKVDAFELRQSVAVFLTAAWVAANTGTDFGRFPRAVSPGP